MAQGFFHIVLSEGHIGERRERGLGWEQGPLTAKALLQNSRQSAPLPPRQVETPQKHDDALPWPSVRADGFDQMMGRVDRACLMIARGDSPDKHEERIGSEPESRNRKY